MELMGGWIGCKDRSSWKWSTIIRVTILKKWGCKATVTLGIGEHCHDPFPEPELSPSHYLLSHMIAIASPSSHGSPSLLTDPPRLHPTCLKGPCTPIPQLWQEHPSDPRPCVAAMSG